MHTFELVARLPAAVHAQTGASAQKRSLCAYNYAASAACRAATHPQGGCLWCSRRNTTWTRLGRVRWPFTCVTSSVAGSRLSLFRNGYVPSLVPMHNERPRQLHNAV